MVISYFLNYLLIRLQQERAVASPPFLYVLIYVRRYGLMDIYVILCVIILYFATQLFQRWPLSDIPIFFVDKEGNSI